MVDRSDRDDMDLMGPSDALELVLDLARSRAEQERKRPTMREAERLSIQAALEQLDHMLQDHWETLDELPHESAGARTLPRRQDYVWWVGGSVPVEQSPSEAILLSVELAEKAKPRQPVAKQSADEALTWVRQFVASYGDRLDRELGGT